MTPYEHTEKTFGEFRSKDQIDTERQALIEQKITDGLMERSPAIEEAKERIDFETLRGVFRDLYKRTGQNPDAMNFVPPESIYAMTEEGIAQRRSETNDVVTAGAFKQGMNIIVINPMTQEHHGEQRQGENNFLETIIHEETHAVSRNRITTSLDMEEVDRGRAKYIYETGVSASYTEKIISPSEAALISDIDIFRAFNEGLTQIIANRVSREYRSRTGQPPREGMSTGYEMEQLLFNIIVHQAAGRLELDEHIVENAFIREYLASGMFSQETSADLDELFFPFFTSTLGTLKGGENDPEQIIKFAEDILTSAIPYYRKEMERKEREKQTAERASDNSEQRAA